MIYETNTENKMYYVELEQFMRDGARGLVRKYKPAIIEYLGLNFSGTSDFRGLLRERISEEDQKIIAYDDMYLYMSNAREESISLGVRRRAVEADHDAFIRVLERLAKQAAGLLVETAEELLHRARVNRILAEIEKRE